MYAAGDDETAQTFSVASGAYLTVTPTSADCRVFSGWYQNGALVSTEPDYRFRPTGDTTLSARFTVEHSYQASSVVPTCTNGGYTEYTCAVCGGTRTEEIPATGHAFGGWTLQKAATCAEEGVEIRVCANDASHTQTRTVDKLRHADGIGDARCDDCGAEMTPTNEEAVCKYCGKIHNVGFFDKLIGFFHSILYFFTHLFGQK